MSLKIKELLVEYQKDPLGLDEAAPRFSWLLDSGEKDTLQTAYRIQVKDGNTVCWDTGRMESGRSRNVEYGGRPLAPCTAYHVLAQVWDSHGCHAEKEARFETGFMDGSLKPWEGARWIGAPRYTVCAENRGVFVIESTFRLENGLGRGGIVLGANDFRLLDASRNELGLAGENYIRFEICLKEEDFRLDIYRVGYAPGDRADVPFASVPLAGVQEPKQPVITSENREDFHTLRVEIDGNNSRTYVDDVLVDAVEEEMPWGKTLVGRTLNPRGHNDVLTYPRLNEIGFCAGPEGRVYFKELQVSNLRTPGRTFIRETPRGNLYGKKSLFDGLETEDGCFVLSDCQLTRDPSNTSIPMLRTVLRTEEGKKVKKARLYITARGIYDCMVNGRRLTDRLLAPGLTQYDRRMNYQTYDLTELLHPGDNGVGVTLASGWWSEAQTFTVKNYNYFGDREALLAKLEVVYEDGSRQVRVTNTEDWKYFGEGPYTYAGFFAGEHFDGRRAWIFDQYSLPDFDDSDWERPEVDTVTKIEESSVFPPGFGRAWPAVHEQEPVLEGGYDAPVYVVERRTAASWKKLGEGIYLYDLEQEMAGVPRITFHEKPGTEIVLRYGEMLYPALPEYGDNAGKLLLENYRDATSTDRYICRGDEDGETYQPRFTFHGYRYIEISGVTRRPELWEVESLQYSSVTEFSGSFQCSDPLLNRFAENVRWSQLCNFINIPTDCPQRNERMGWAGDTHVFCRTALLNSDLKLFYERNLQAMADLQTSEGRYPEIAPVGGGFGGITYECATIFIAWELYQQYGDLKTLRRFYPGMKKYMAYMEDKGLPGEGRPDQIGPLGDWLAPEETDLQLLWNAFYYRETWLMSRIAGLLGDEEGEKTYAAAARRTREYWNKTFVDPETGKTRKMDGTLCDTQTSYVLGLAYRVMEDRRRGGEHLAEKTAKGGDTVGTGFFGTGLLNQVLCDTGHADAAYRLMRQTRFPSWLYPVTQGATTIWERWDSYTTEKGFGGQNAMNSFNHYSLGSVLSWMYSYILGVRQKEEYPGFGNFTLEPVIGDLEYARGSVCTPYGTVWCGWEKRDGQVEYTCRIPANTRATVCLPDGTKQEIGSGEHTFRFREG